MRTPLFSDDASQSNQSASTSFYHKIQMSQISQENALKESIITAEEEPTQQRKSIFARAFAPITPGAMRGSIFALLASAMGTCYVQHRYMFVKPQVLLNLTLGTGMFNLPFRIHQIGVIPYVFFVLVGGVFSYLGMYMLSRIILKYKTASYSEMSQKASGVWLKRLSQFCLIIYPWGITVCFQVIFAKFFIQLLDDNFSLGLYSDREHQVYTTLGNWIRIAVNVGAILLNLPFILRKDIGILQKLSLVGVFCVVINAVIILGTFFTGSCLYEYRYISIHPIGFTDKKGVQYHGVRGVDWSDVKWFQFHDAQDVSLQVQGIASIIFCYVNHQLVFPLAYDLKNPTKRRLDKIFGRVHVTEFIIYSIVGLSGYLLLVQHVKLLPIAPVVMASIQTLVMTIGKLLMLDVLFFAVPLNLYPARATIFDAFSLNNTDKNRIIVSLGLAFSGCLVAVLFQQVNSYFGLLGGTAGVMMAGGIPAICYYKFNGWQKGKEKAMLIFTLIVSLVAIAGAIMSIADPQ